VSQHRYDEKSTTDTVSNHDAGMLLVSFAVTVVFVIAVGMLL